MAKKSKVSVDDFSFFDEDEAQPLNIIAKNSQKISIEKSLSYKSGISSALDSHELTTSQPLESKELKRESGVSSALDKKHEKHSGVRQPLGTALDVRESGVRQTENQALDINLLVGKEKTLVFLICNESRKIGCLETNYISTDDLKIKLAIDSNGLRNLIHRVKEKGFVNVTAKQLGRNGLRKFKISQPIYQQFLASPLDSRESGVSQPVAQALGTALETLSSSSSISLYNKTTTTSDVEKFDFKLDQVSEFGLTASAVSRCFELYPNLENEKMQDLLNRFAQFMRSGEGKRVQNARGFFISLAEQMSKGMTPLDHIETAEAILMRELVIKKRAQKAERELLEKELQDFDFEDWWIELSPKVRDELVPPNNIASSGSHSQKILAKQVHAEKFWPERKVRATKEMPSDI